MSLSFLPVNCDSRLDISYLSGNRILIIFSNHQRLGTKVVPERLAKFLFGAIHIIVAPPLFSVPTRHQNPDDFRTIKPLLKSLKFFEYN